jgi:hypothetical protein
MKGKTMDTAELIRRYEEIIASLKTLIDHPLEAVASSARMQIDRCERSVREIKAHHLGS